MKLISILMPTYNNAEYITLAVNDIINQTYEHWELIIINDGSTDNTIAVLEKFSSNSNIKILNLTENKGICNALNIAFSLSKGDYILRCDSDDRCDSDRIEQQYNYLVSNNFDLVGTSVTTINTSGSIIGKASYESHEGILKKLSAYESPVLHIWLSKREVYEKLGGYRFSGVEDYDFLLRAYDEGFKISNASSYYGVFIRKHSNNTANVAGWSQRKKFNLVRRLHIERVKFRTEKSKFDDADLNVNTIGNEIHKISNMLLVTAIESKSFILKYPLIIVSALISPYQFQYLFNRVVSRIIRLKN